MRDSRHSSKALCAHVDFHVDLARDSGLPAHNRSRWRSVAAFVKGISMRHTTRFTKAAMALILFVPVGIFLALIPYSYPVRELLACWLFFGLLLVAITPVALCAVLACYAGIKIIHWAWRRPQMTPALKLDLPSPVKPFRLREG